MSKVEFNENEFKKLLEALSNNLEDYDFYNDVLFNGEEIMDMVFKDYISDVEGSSCCADKSGFIVSRIKKALKERKNIPLCQTYAEYKNAGGYLGGINETNTDLNKVCYWCPKTIKDTDTAIALYFSLLNVPSYCRKMLKEKEQELNHQKAMWNELKEWVSFTQPKNINDEFISGVCSAYSNVIDKMQELEQGEKDDI